MTILFGIARSGARYFYCPMMNATFTTSCCGGGESHERQERESPTLDAPDCCKARRLGSLPSVTTSASPELAPVRVAALLPALDFPPARVAAHAVPPRAHLSGAGPPSAKKRRAELMVWTS